MKEVWYSEERKKGRRRSEEREGKEVGYGGEKKKGRRQRN